MGFSKYYNITWAIDNNLDAIRTYKYNHHGTQVIHKNILDIDFSKGDFEGLLGVAGSPPCQDFSGANRKKDPNSERANLSIKQIDIIEQIKPKWFFMENVASIPLRFKEEIIKKLRKIGYKVTAKTVYASDYGSVQMRRRWILTAHKDRHIYPEKIISKRSALEILSNEQSEIKPRPKTLEALKHLSKGKWDALPGQIQKSYFVVDPNKLMPSVINPTKARYVKPDLSGYLSMTELYRSQGFPDDYRFFGGLVSRGQQVANAVPVEMAQAFAKEFLKYN